MAQHHGTGANPSSSDTNQRIVAALGRSPLFRGLAPDAMCQVAGFGEVQSCRIGDELVTEGQPSDSFLLILQGDAAVMVSGKRQEATEVARLGAMDSVGEMGLILRQPRTATVVARSPMTVVRYTEAAFYKMFRAVPNFGAALCKALAGRLAEADRHLSIPEADSHDAPSREVRDLLPMDFIQRYDVLPLEFQGNVLTLGFVHDPRPRVVNAVRTLLPSVELRPVRIDRRDLDAFLEGALAPPSPTRGGGAATPAVEDPEAHAAHRASFGGSRRPGQMPALDQLLERAVGEGVSDLHLSAGHKPRWRVDGEIQELSDLPELGAEQVLELMVDKAMQPRHRQEFADTNDSDFAYEIEGLSRFRVNVFRDHRGVGAVLRQIPSKILTFEQLGLPAVVQKLCSNPKGLILVTGPTGSGKSTTLAAMIDWINRNRAEHIITLEDPIEFVHKSRGCLVNQREVGAHTASFHRALKAALREDPDIVLVGELRDRETMSLALETANTGHLVFGTLHTATAVSTVDRIIGMYPADEQSQVRGIIAESLRGVVAQCLCRRVGGGRVAALEVLVGSFAVSNLVREGKTFQIPNLMSAGKGAGNMMLNEQLAVLVEAGKVEFEEAMAKAIDKQDLARKCKRAV